MQQIYMINGMFAAFHYTSLSIPVHIYHHARYDHKNKISIKLLVHCTNQYFQQYTKTNYQFILAGISLAITEFIWDQCNQVFPLTSPGYTCIHPCIGDTPFPKAGDKIHHPFCQGWGGGRISPSLFRNRVFMISIKAAILECH